jgi:hypothetical protein
LARSCGWDRSQNHPKKSANIGSEDDWPSVSEFATEEWVLAKKMRRMFRRELLEQWVGNAIFVQSPSLEHDPQARNIRVAAKNREAVLGSNHGNGRNPSPESRLGRGVLLDAKQ